MKAKKVAILLVLAVSLTLLGGCDESEPVESTPIEASGTESAQSDTVPGSEVTLPDDVITAETPTSGESADPDDTHGGDDAQDAGESEHTHTWVDETRYNTVHHDAVTHVVHHDAQTHTVHHDAVTHEETQYNTERIECETCRDCGAQFTDHGAALSHLDSTDHSGLVGDVMTVQTPYTSTVVDQDAWDETIVDIPAWDETVVDQEAYDEQVPYTVTVCSECGKEK